MRNGIKKAVNKVCENLDLMSHKVSNADQVYQVAMVASNFDSEIAEIHKQIYLNDPHGLHAVSIGSEEQHLQAKPSLRHLKGYSIDNGFLSPYFAQGFEKQEINYDQNVYFLLSESVIED
jgi:chaperonin GroEL (HSP60 family)